MTPKTHFVDNQTQIYTFSQVCTPSYLDFSSMCTQYYLHVFSQLLMCTPVCIFCYCAHQVTFLFSLKCAQHLHFTLKCAQRRRLHLSGHLQLRVGAHPTLMQFIDFLKLQICSVIPRWSTIAYLFEEKFNFSNFSACYILAGENFERIALSVKRNFKDFSLASDCALKSFFRSVRDKKISFGTVFVDSVQ